MKHYSLRLFFYLIFSFSLLSVSLHSQIMFHVNTTTQLYDARQTRDNGYIAVGKFGDMACAIKLNAFGDTIWTRLFLEQTNPKAFSVDECFDGSYIIIGNAKNPTGSYTFLIKINEQGDTLWTRKYSNSLELLGSFVKQTSDRGFIFTGIVGNPLRDILITKTDSVGNIEWNKSFGSPDQDRGAVVLQTADGGYVVSGTLNGPYGDKYALLRLNQIGDTLWTKCFGDTLSGDTLLPQSQETNKDLTGTTDHGYALTGNSGIYQSGNDFYLVVVDSLGNLLWTREYGSTGMDMSNGIVQNTNGGFTLNGTTLSFGLTLAGYTIGLDAIGNVVWSKMYDNGGSEELTGIFNTQDSGFLYSSNYGQIYKTNPTGTTGCMEINVNTQSTIPNTAALNYPVRVAVPGIFSYPTAFTITSGIPVMTICGKNIGIESVSLSSSFEIVPNPSNGNFSIHLKNFLAGARIEIYNTSGAEVFTSEIESESISINLENLPPGIYCVRLSEEKSKHIKKIILNRP